MNRNLLVFAVSAIMAASCGTPLSLSVPVEKRVRSENNVDFSGGTVAVVGISPLGYKDSVLLSSMAMGVAGRLESDLGADSGSIYVYTMFSSQIGTSSPADVKYMAAYTGGDFLIVLDSLHVGDYSAVHPDERVYADGRYMVQTFVSIPYSLVMKVYGPENTLVRTLRRDSAYEWVLLSPQGLSDVTAIGKAQESLRNVFSELGESLAQELTPQWVLQEKSIYVYDNDGWIQAYYDAAEFRWKEAMDFWLTQVDPGNAEKAACAAANISVACEILEMDALAARWREKSEKFSDYTYLR